MKLKRADFENRYECGLRDRLAQSIRLSVYTKDVCAVKTSLAGKNSLNLYRQLQGSQRKKLIVYKFKDGVKAGNLENAQCLRT